MNNIQIDNYEVLLTSQVINILKNNIQVNPKDNENGGILLGKTMNNQIHILKISTPNKMDQASRFTFDRHKIPAQIIIDYEFENSSGQVIYLGEWHTHPEKVPKPSDVDLKMIENQFYKNKISTPFLILIIQGTEKIYLAIYDGVKISSTLI